MNEQQNMEKTISRGYAPSGASNQRPTADPDVVFVFPASFAQQRLWFLNQLDPDDPSYNIPVAFHLKGRLHLQALERSLQELVRRHEILRTTFSVRDGEPVQVVAPGMPVSFSVKDMTSSPGSTSAADIQQVIRQEILRPFDLSRGPLLRMLLLRLGEEEFVLSAVIHHVISDGWSNSILFSELSALYKDFSTGQPPSLPEPPIQYADFSVWQREWLQGEALRIRMAYWTERLAGIPSTLKLPTDRPRPPTWTYRGARQTILLCAEMTEALAALSQREGGTLFMTLLAAFQVLLGRYTGQENIAVGTPIAGRNRPEIEKLIGFFVNTLVLRTDLSGNPGFRELLARVRDVCLGAYDHQDVPFERLVEELRPERQLNQSPLFQVMFAFQNEPRTTPAFTDMDVSPLEIDSGTAKFDLSLSFESRVKELLGTLVYRTDLYDAETMTYLLEHYRNLLRHIIADPDQPIGTLPLLSDAERRRLLVEWNEAKVDYPQHACIHHLFEAQAENYPDRLAVVFEGHHLTYQELNTRADQLALHLQQIGIGPEKLVGLCADRSLEMMVGIVGILKSGGAYLPLNPDDPADRQAFMIDDARIAALLTQERFRSRWSGLPLPLICLDTDWPASGRNGAASQPGSVCPDNLAYVMYTSGSTGRPKGVMITHRNVVGFLSSYKHVTRDGERRIGTSVAPFSFDTSVEEFFSALCFGGTVHLVRPEHSTDGQYFARYLVEQGITTTYIVPALLPDVAAHLRSTKDRMKLRCVITGLEPKKERALQHFRDLSDDLRILNAYGPTETTYGASAFNFQKAANPDQDVPIGVPFPNYQIYLVDARLQPVPVGVTGEILIGGVGLARGYLNRPELTDEKFIPNPFSSVCGSRLYRTGDFGRYRRDGTIEFLGRLDHQVKLRGYRIELGEIETILVQHPIVRQAVVMAREDVPGDRRLVAYLLTDGRPAPPTTELRHFLQGKLPEYMIPSAFVAMEAWPLTSSGKVDRAALPAPDQERSASELGETFVCPRDELETRLTQLWEKVLNIRPVGVRDNFFDLGGHSLLAVRLFSEIKKAWGKSLPLSILFQHATVEDVARLIRSEDDSAPPSDLVQIQAGGDRRPLFCVVPVTDDALGFASLARALGPEQPFYGLQFPVTDESPSATSIEAMAARCIRAMQSHQPKGPYLLGGACLGGFVAYEIACQLQRAGHTVPLLFILDSSQPPPLITLQEYIPRLLFQHLPRGEILFCLKHDLTEKIRKYRRQLARSEEGRRFYRVWKSHEQARRAYQPRPYPGRVTLFLSREFSIRFPEYQARWSTLARGGVDALILPGRHTDSLRAPQAAMVAQKLTACLQGTADPAVPH